MGTWPANINQEYSIQPGTPFDPKVFDFKTANVQVQPTKTPSNQSYFVVAMDTFFTNPFPFSMQKMNIQLQATIYYKKVPIVMVSTLPTEMFGIERDRNRVHLKMVTVPEYNSELMTLIGRVADGIETMIVIDDLNVNGDPKWQWVQDMIDGWSIPYVIPRIEDIPMTYVETL
jgi:hypothetical protein